MADKPDDKTLYRLSRRALKRLAEAHDLDDPLLVDQVEVTHPDTHGRVFKFTAAASGNANGPRFDVIVDAKGKPQDSTELADLFASPTTFRPVTPRLAPEVTVQPATNVLTLNPGDHFDETVTVKIPKDTAAPKADVYFLADTTGSMDGILNAVQAGANSILTALGGVTADLAFGVGNYRDFPDDAYAFQHQLAPTTVPATVTAAINSWSAAGGGDFPEGQLFALDSLAQPPGGAVGWRAGAKRIIVWFGDAPGHDPICPAISGGAAAITEASVTAKLTAENISVIAISTATPGLDGDPTSGPDYLADCGPAGGNPGQASNIAAATGGQFVTGIQPADVVTTITTLLTTALGSIHNVKLVPAGLISGCVHSISPAAGYGPLDKEKEHTLPFEVKFIGDKPCMDEDQVFEGALDVVADGVVIGSKPVRITVPACKAELVYSVKFVCGTQEDGCGKCMPVTPGRYATEINIHNFSSREVKVSKRVIPVVLAGAAAGREPDVARVRGGDSITLPPHTATMDDCCRLSELLFGAPQTGALNIGLLEITASDEVAVTAVYTATGLEDGVSIDVENISPRRR